jgi:hypothetical protein
MVYNDPKMGDTDILILGQSIYLCDKMQSSLLCLNQLRSNGLIADDVPQHQAPHNQPSSNSIQSLDDEFTLPLSLKGVKSYLNNRIPTQEELDTCKWINLTNERDWDPHLDTFQEPENFTSLQITLTQDRSLFFPKLSNK